MATAEKISISLGPEDLEWARRRAKSEVKSLSAVVAEALSRQRQAEARARLLAALGTDDITEQEREEVRSEWRAPRVNQTRAANRSKKRARK